MRRAVVRGGEDAPELPPQPLEDPLPSQVAVPLFRPVEAVAVALDREAISLPVDDHVDSVATDAVLNADLVLALQQVGEHVTFESGFAAFQKVGRLLPAVRRVSDVLDQGTPLVVLMKSGGVHRMEYPEADHGHVRRQR